MKKYNDNFIMSPKIDFAFKLVFGDEKNKDILIDFLSAALRLPKSEFEDIEFINTELPREFEEDKKGILDLRVKTSEGKQINVEIQLVQSKYMPERTLFYWAKMYAGQIKSGERYKKLKKCIAINIVDYKFIDDEKFHTKFQLMDDEISYVLTDVIEIHFLELPKLKKLSEKNDNQDPVKEWMEFINANSKEVMKLLAEKNENIDRAYKILEAASRDEKKRLAYESRQIAIMDELTRLDEAIEEGLKRGKKEGIKEGEIQLAVKMIKNGIDIEIVAKISGISIEILKKHL